MQEAVVTAISDELFKYVVSDTEQIIPVPHSPYEVNAWRKKAEHMENSYSKRMGILIGPVEVVVHTAILKGLKRTDEGAMTKEYAVIAGIETDYAAQTVVYDVASEDQRFLEKAALPIEEEFPEATRAFFLGEFNYGRPLEVIRHENNKVDVWICTMVRHTHGFAILGGAMRLIGTRKEKNQTSASRSPNERNKQFATPHPTRLHASLASIPLCSQKSLPPSVLWSTTSAATWG